MLDVVFIMLIFFIVTATFIKQAGIEVLRPDAQTWEQKPTVSVLVAISDSGEIWIDKKRVDVTAVRAHIERIHAEKPEGRSGDPGRPKRKVREVEGGPERRARGET